jgi:signal transduction histidine kinase
LLKIHQLFLRTYFTIFAGIIITFTLLTYFWAKSLYLHQIEKNLIKNIDTVAIFLKDKKSMGNIENIVNTLNEELDLRITIINSDGKVIAESDKELSDISNHANRAEIVQAKNEDIGKDARLSVTLNKELLYIAKKVKINEQTYYIRMADYTNKINENFMKLSLDIVYFVVLFLVIIFLASYFITKRIKKETDSILSFLIQLSNKKSSFNLSSNYTYEFDKIAKLLNKVALKLSKKQKQKSRQTAKLKLANRQKDEIISAISHEFKNPIAIISGYSETIINDEKMPEAIKIKFLNKIYTNANKMSQIVDKLRLTLKLEEEKQAIVLTPCSIKKIVENCIGDLEDKYKDRKIHILGEDTRIRVDEILISMAILNLLENALKYSEDEIVINILKDSVCIVDKGIGIDESEIKNINQKFYRVSNNGWNNSLGLGLFIVQSILSLHYFSLKVKSEIGKGSEFCIEFE